MSVGDFVDRRPSSDELVDLHISIVPIEHWIERLNYASFEVIGDTFSVGFIRVQPEANIRSIRSDISRQLGEDILPKNYVFLKHVGRCLALVREKQELQLKVKSFLPPLNAMPEIFVLPGMPSMYTYTVLPPIKPQSVDSPNQEVRSQNETEYSTPKITQNNRTTKETNHQYNRQRNGQIPLDNGYENNVQNSPERESVVRKQRHVSGKSAYTRESIPIRQPTHPGQSKDQREFLENGHVNQNENTPMGAKSIVHEGPTQKQVHYSMPNSPYSDDDEDHNEGYSLNPKHPSTPSHSNTVSTDLPIVMSASPAPVPQLTHRPPHSEHSSVIHTNLQKSGLNNYGNEHTSGQASPDHDQTPPPHSHVVVNHAQSHSDKTNGYMPASHMTSPGQFSKLSDRHSERPAHNSIHDSENMAEHISIISHGSNGSDKSSKRRRFIQSAIRDHSTNDAPRDGDGDAPADQIYSPEVARLQTNKSHEHYDKKSENNNESYPPQHSNTNPLTSPHDATQNPSQIPLTSKLTPKPDLDSSEPLSPHDLLYPQYPELQIPHNTPVTVPSANPSSKGSKRSEVKETSIEAIRTEENEQVINSQRSPPRDHGNDNIGDKTPRDQMVGEYTNIDPMGHTESVNLSNQQLGPPTSNIYNDYNNGRPGGGDGSELPDGHYSNDQRNLGTAVFNEYSYSPNSSDKPRKSKQRSPVESAYNSPYENRPNEGESGYGTNGEENAFITENNYTNDVSTNDVAQKNVHPSGNSPPMEYFPLKPKETELRTRSTEGVEDPHRGTPDGMPMAPIITSGSGQYQKQPNLTPTRPTKLVAVPNVHVNQGPHTSVPIPVQNELRIPIQVHDSPEAIRIPQFSKPPTDSPLDHLPNVHTENYSPSKKATSPALKKTPIANNRTKDLRSSSPSRRTGTPEKAALWEELQRIRESRRQSEETRQDLVRRAKHATSQIAQKRTSVTHRRNSVSKITPFDGVSNQGPTIRCTEPSCYYKCNNESDMKRHFGLIHPGKYKKKSSVQARSEFQNLSSKKSVRFSVTNQTREYRPSNPLPSMGRPLLARDQWKKQYFNEKKRTAPLEELCNRVRSQLDSSHQRLLTSLAEESNQKVSLIIGPIGNRNKPSLQSNNKIRVSKLQHELDSIRRQVQDAKVKLSGEIKLRHQAEQDVKSMREDLLRKKIASHVAYRKVARGNTLFARSKRSVRAFN